MKYSLFILLILTSCSTFSNKKKPKCGNGVIDDIEECDSENLGGITCEVLGYTDGETYCDSNCHIIDLNCFGGKPYCGDGIIQGIEDCDGTNLDGKSCNDYGYEGGTLGCYTDCGVDISQCSGKIYECGDGIIQGIEDCDGTDLDGENCINLGFYGGEITCTAECKYDISNCETEGKCGDGILQEEYGEECDGDDIGDVSCISQGYYGGDIICDSQCHISYYNCMAQGKCGDDVIETGYGELCDGDNFSGETCNTKGYYGGNLICSNNCTSIDISNCESEGRCGDLAVQESYGEVCDGTNLNDFYCSDRGFFKGNLQCNNCMGFDETGCSHGIFRGGSLGDYVRSITFDSTGNILIAGTTENSLASQNQGGTDLYYAQYSKSGNLIWEYQTGTSQIEVVRDMVTDNMGNVYITGYSLGNFDGYQNQGDRAIFVVKLSNIFQNKVWSRLIQSPFSDDAMSITLDENQDILITGQSDGYLNSTNVTQKTSVDIFLAKLYAINGDSEWITQYGTSGDDLSYGVTCDSSGFIYISGSVTENFDGSVHSGGSDLFVGKFDSAGNNIWYHQFASNTGGDAYSINIVFDSHSDNLFVSGYSNGGFVSSNLLNKNAILLSLDTNGTEIFRREWGSNNIEIVLDSNIDSSSNSYITGITSGSFDGNTNQGVYDIFITKYNTTGTKLWTKFIGVNLEDYGYSIAINSNGTVCIGGHSKSPDLFNDSSHQGDYDMLIYCVSDQ